MGISLGSFACPLELGPRRHRGMGGRQQKDRPPQPDLVGRRRARRVLDLVHLVGDGAVHAGSGVRLLRRRQILAGRHGNAGRGMPAIPLHVRHREVRRAQLDDILGVGVADSHRRHHGAAGPSRSAAVAVPGVCGAGRSRRRQLRLVDDKHQRVLSAAAEGLGTGTQRRRRQPGGADRPAGRPAGHRERRQPAAVLGVCGVPGAAGGRGDRCRAVHG